MKIEMMDLFQNLDPKEYEEMEIKNVSVGEASLENVKTKVFKRINMEENLGNNRHKKEKRKPFRVSWVAAILIFAIGTTAFVFSKPEYFKWIFGENAKILEENIQDIVATASNEDIIFTVESVLSDGNQNYFVVSIENKNGQGIGENITPMITFKIEEMEESDFASLSTIKSERIPGPDSLKNKAYYIITISTNEDLIGKNMKLNLNGFIATGMNVETENSLNKLEKGLSVSFNIENNNQNNIKTIIIDEPSTIDKKYYITEIKLSNLGLNLKGKKAGSTENIPTPNIKLKYKNGDIGDLSHKTCKNPDVDFPNAGHSFHGGVEGDFVNTITFGELIDINDIESIIVDGAEYKLK
jgi:hypothetical protein